MMEYLNIGATPSGEDCAQVGRPDYGQKAKAECARFVEQIRRHYPEPDRGYLKVKGFSHDFGTYYEVCAYYDPEDEEASAWAFQIEGDYDGKLEFWDEEEAA